MAKKQPRPTEVLRCESLGFLGVSLWDVGTPSCGPGSAVVPCVTPFLCIFALTRSLSLSLAFPRYFSISLAFSRSVWLRAEILRVLPAFSSRLRDLDVVGDGTIFSSGSSPLPLPLHIGSRFGERAGRRRW